MQLLVLSHLLDIDVVETSSRFARWVSSMAERNTEQKSQNSIIFKCWILWNLDMYIGIKISHLIFYIDHNLHLFSYCPWAKTTWFHPVWRRGPAGPLGVVHLLAFEFRASALILYSQHYTNKEMLKSSWLFFQRVLYTNWTDFDPSEWDGFLCYRQALELFLGWSVKVLLHWLLYSEPEGVFSVFVETAIAIGKWIIQAWKIKH